jgi:hypothetical protein
MPTDVIVAESRLPALPIEIESPTANPPDWRQRREALPPAAPAPTRLVEIEPGALASTGITVQ